MEDSKGTLILTGDLVRVLYIDRSRGAEMWMLDGEVVGFGRTRVKIRFPGYIGVCSVGPECLRVTGHVD